jgi:Protein of unknown function (DUF3024)
VNEIPLHTRRLVEKLLQGYCDRICPPSARHAVLLGFDVGFDRATILEIQRIFGLPGTGRPVELAQFRYDAARNRWRLYHRDEHSRWRAYPRQAATHGFVELLREFDADPAGVFWGRLNGRSLRWCSPRGRCADCDLRYCQVLGVAEPANSLERTPAVRRLTSAST